MRSSRVRASTEGETARRVLGVDPGTVVTGWGVVEQCGQAVLHVASGVVRARGSRADRLAFIHRALCEICERFAPCAVSLEQSFVGDNVQTAFRLGEARGAVMVAAAGAGVAVVEYAPAQIKIAVAGSGRAAKSQMQLMVGRLLGVDAPLEADEADALGAALCHVHASRFQATLERHAALGGRAPGRARTSWRR